MVDRLAPGLLGGHVLRRAGDDAALRQAGVVDRAGQAEVGDLDPLDAVLQQDVGRLDVAVDQPLGVGRGQPGGRLHADPQDRREVQRRGAVEPVLERAARDELHDQVGQPVRLVDGVDGDDVLVANRRRGPGLAGEPLPGRAAGRELRAPAP